MCARWFRLDRLAGRFNQLRTGQSWLSQHVSVSERLCRNHFWRPVDGPDPRVGLACPGPFDRFAGRLNQLRTGQSWLSQHVSVSERLCRNHFWRPVDGPDPRVGLTCPGPLAVLSVSRVRTGCSASFGRKVVSVSSTDPELPAPSGYPRYSVFVSYSRRDDAAGGVEQLVEALRREARQVLDDGFEVFFDRHDLRTREEWQTQLAWAVRESEVLMACVSKPYFESDFCLWEFQEYEVKPTGPDTGEGLVPVLLEDTSEQDQPDQEHRYWHARVTKMQGQDRKDVFTRDAAPTLEGAEARIRALGDDLYQQRQNRRR